MSIRNSILAEILSAYGGDPTGINTRNKLLELILIQNSGVATNPQIRNTLLADIVIALGGVITNPMVRNQLLQDIVLAAAGTIRNPSNRNMLLEDWLLAAENPSLCRYYYNFDGFDDYIGAPPMLMAGECEVEFFFSSNQSGVNRYFYDSNGIDRFYLWIDVLNKFNAPVVSTIFVDDIETTDCPTDGLAHKVNVKCADGQNLLIERFITNGTAFFEGKLWGVRVWTGGDKDNGTLIRDYAIDDNSTTIIDSVSGQNGTLINGTPEQWEYICEDSSAWNDGESWNDGEPWID